MSLKSMTGFARTSGHTAPWAWAWELKAVNAKGLDVRLRVPAGFDRIEAEARARLTQRLARGTCYATLTTQREATTPQIKINEDALRALAEALGRVAPGSLRAPSMDALLGVRGIVEVTDAADDEATIAAGCAAVLAALDVAIADLVAMREREGAHLQSVLSQRIERIADLTQAAEDCPGRRPEAVRARLAQSVAALTDASPALDPSRLHQEAILIAAKADIREELDRLKGHVVAARDLLASATPVGRKLDFLAQEFGREANTLCAKSNDAALTAIGMELRVEIEQLREQVQNIE
jgi:uncharacterized protein (TIGR00255 family)